MTTAPYPNINGTSAAELLSQHTDAAEAIREAIAKVQQCYPNGRDFQTAPTGSHSRAQDEHRHRLQRLDLIWVEIREIAETISERTA